MKDRSEEIALGLSFNDKEKSPRPSVKLSFSDKEKAPSSKEEKKQRKSGLPGFERTVQARRSFKENFNKSPIPTLKLSSKDIEKSPRPTLKLSFSDKEILPSPKVKEKQRRKSGLPGFNRTVDGRRSFKENSSLKRQDSDSSLRCSFKESFDKSDCPTLQLSFKDNHKEKSPRPSLKLYFSDKEKAPDSPKVEKKRRKSGLPGFDRTVDARRSFKENSGLERQDSDSSLRRSLKETSKEKKRRKSAGTMKALHWYNILQ